MWIIFFVLNFIIICFFASAVYPIFGLIYTAVSFVVTITCSERKLGCFIIASQLKTWNYELIDNMKEGKKILVSAAFMALALKIDAIIGLVIYGGTVAILILAILLATGYFFSGTESGMTVTGANLIAKGVVKLYIFLNSLASKIAEFLIEVEFYMLGIEKR